MIMETIQWDYKIDDKIEFFDFEKSYEITQYRPINKTKGLDFNPDWFREDAITKQSSGRYNKSLFGTKSYREFWDERKRRCIEGYSVNGYRLTGDNYFFLNYYNLKTSSVDTINQSYGFPAFLVFQYEYFHYIEMCEILGYDIAVLKSRGIGWSEIAASFASRPYTMIPNYRILVSAFSDRHLGPTLDKIWKELDWLNGNTENAFKRVRMNINTKDHKRASKKDKDLTEYGHMSEIEGIIANDPDKLRGDRVQKLIYEEAGGDPMLIKKWVKGEALITVLGGKRVGMRIAFGTGGSSKASSMEGLKKMLLNPQSYNVLPVRHKFTKSGDYLTSGYFIPAYRIVYELIDKRGWCDPDACIKWYEKEREKRASDARDLLDYKAEYCFTIEEALIQTEDNLFPREELADQLTQLEIYKNGPKIQRGCLTWLRDSDDRPNGVKWRNDDNGNIQIIEHPLLTPPSEFDKGGDSYKNLYVGGIDSIDIGTADSANPSNKASSFCIVIKKRVLGLDNPQYVAMYKDRPKDPREAYENAAKLLTYYGCQAVLESTRTAILTYFRDHRYIHLLMKRPRSTMSDISKGNPNMYGAPATEKVITHQRELIYDFILDYSYTIGYVEMLNQLLEYSDERKKDFDIVAALGMAELGDEEMSMKKPEAREPKQKEFSDIGWYKDSRGYKHYGKIPKTDEERNERTRVNQSDSWLYKGDL